MGDAFLEGYTKVALCPQAYVREDIIYNGDYCLWKSTVSCSDSDMGPLDPPWGDPQSILGEWALSENIRYGQVGPGIRLNDSRFYAGYSEYEARPYTGHPNYTCEISVSRRPNCTTVYKGKLDWADAMATLRANYPWGSGWRIVAVYRKGASDTNDSDFKFAGTSLVTDSDNYAANAEQDAGVGTGGQDGGYSGASVRPSPAVKLQRSLEAMHKDDSVSTEVELTLAEGIITQDPNSIDSTHPDGTYSITPPEGVKNGEDGWSVGVEPPTAGNLCTGISGAPGLPYCYRTIASSTFCIYIYLTQVSGTSAAGDGGTFTDGFEFGTKGGGQYWGGSNRASGSASASNASQVYDDGSYSYKIDGGVDDRSNGQRFIGTSYEQINGFDYDTKVTHDSLYVPTTTRWGETLDLTDPDTTYHGRKLGYGVVCGRGDFLDYDITLEYIENRMSEADRMAFTENCKYDDVGHNCVHLGTPDANYEEVGHEAAKAFDQLDSTYYESEYKYAQLHWDFCENVLEQSTLASGVTAGASSITVADATNWPTSGTLYVGATRDKIAYTSRSGNTLSGIPATGDFAIGTHSSGVVVTRSAYFSGKVVRKYSLKGMPEGSTNKNPRSWTFEAGYHAGETSTITWVVLDTQTDVVTWEADEEKVFDCLTNSVRYRYYRLNITKSVDDTSKVALVDFAMYEADTWTVGDWVYGVILTPSGPVTRFAGTIVNKHRELTSEGQSVKYEASGLVQRLDDLGFAFEVSFANKNVQEMVQLIASYIPNEIVVSTSGVEILPTTTIPDINWTCLSYKKALDMLMDIAGYYGYYITPSKVLTFVNLRYDDSTAVTQARDDARKQSYAIPAEGVGVDSGAYYVMEHLLSVDVSGTRTRCKIMGDYPQYEITENVPLVTDSSGLTPPYCIKVDTTEALSGATALEQTYMVVLSHNKVQTQLLSNEERAIDVQVKYSGKVYGSAQVNPGWYEPRSNPYNFITKDLYSAFYITAYDSLVSMRVTYSYKGSTPIIADTGWVGTAYTHFGVQNCALVRDDQFKKQVLDGVVIRDDTSDLQKYALQLIDPYKDWYVGGSVTLDGLRTESGLNNLFNFSGTTQDWSGINAYPKAIIFNLEDLTTRLDLTNSYFIGSILDPEVRQQLKELQDTADVQKILNRLTIIESRDSQF